MIDFLKSDLSRNFGIGFLAGAILVVMSNGAAWNAEFAPQVQAAEIEAVAD